MLEIHELVGRPLAADASLTLPFEQRSRSRLRTRLDDGTEVGLFLSRGRVLRHGDRLRASDGRIIEIRAAAETVSTATASRPLLLIRAAYHLGNRHVALAITADALRYRHDHVLDAMVGQLGLMVNVEQAPFEPETGAYGGGHHHHR